MHCFLPSFCHCSLFLLFTPSRKSKSRLGFNDGRSWSLGQTSVAAGGPCKSCSLPSAPSPTHCPPQFGTSPHPVWPGADPKHWGCYSYPWPVPTHHPSPRAAPRRSALPHSTPLCSLFVQGQSNPSSCRLNLHTKDQCKDHQLCGYKSRVHSKTTQTRPLLRSVCN